jgi:hypothetical protein
MDKLAEFKARMEKARIRDDGSNIPGAPGMKIDDILEEEIKEEEEEEEEEGNIAIVKPRTMQKKTKAQRNKEAKRLAEVRRPISSFFFFTRANREM